MHLPLPYSALLAGVLATTTVQVVDSFPLVISPPKMITMSLKRVKQARNEHGTIYLQLHINRSVRRLARLTGCQEPTDEELLSRLERQSLWRRHYGQPSLGTLNLPGHTFRVATTENVEFFFDSVVFDGLMGLSSSTGSQQKVLTPVEALAKPNLISELIVSYKISRIAGKLNDGAVTFAGLDSPEFDAQTLVTLPNVNTRGLWEADLDAVTVNSNAVGLSNRTAILNTGTTLLAVPLDDATKIHALINGSNTDGQGGFSVPCTLTDKVAPQFGGHSFEIDPRDVAFAPLDPASPEGDCLSGIIATSITGIGDTQWIVGDVFLKNAYFSTDVAKNTLSLAELV